MALIVSVVKISCEGDREGEKRGRKTFLLEVGSRYFF